MSFATEIASDCANIADASLQASVEGAYTDFETAMKAIIVSAAPSLSETGAIYVGWKDEVRKSARMLAANLADQAD